MNNISDKLREAKSNSNSNPVTKISRNELTNVMGGYAEPNETTFIASGSGCGSNTCVCLDCLPEEK